MDRMLADCVVPGERFLRGMHHAPQPVSREGGKSSYCSLIRKNSRGARVGLVKGEEAALRSVQAPPRLVADWSVP